MYDAKKMVEVAILSALAAVLYLISYYIPIMTLVIILLPIVFIIATLRNGVRLSIYGAIVFGVLAIILSDPLYGIFMYLFGGIGGVLLGMTARRNESIALFILVGTLFYSLFFIGSLVATQELTGMSILNEFDLVAEEAVRMDLVTPDDASVLLETIRISLPGSIITGAILITVMIHGLTSRIRRQFTPDYKARPFSSFQLPNNILLGILLLIGGAYLADLMELADMVTLQINIFLVASIVFALQGIAVVFFYIEQKGLSPLLKGAFVVSLLLFQLFILGASLLGIADLIFKFRQVRTSR